MATFKLEKGGKFSIAKEISKIRLGIGWAKCDIDVDAHAFACIHTSSGAPSFYNDGSHAVSYANADLKRNKDKSFATPDGSFHHSGDNRTGEGEGDDERITIDLALLPEDIEEIMLFVTIHEAVEKGIHFGMVPDSYVSLYDVNNDAQPLAQYSLKNQCDGLISMQLGSMIKTDGKWAFEAVGKGSPTEGLGEIWGKLS